MRHYKKMTVDLGFQTFCFHTHLRRSLEHVPFELRLRAGDSDDCLPGHWNFSACHLGCGAGGLRLCCIFAMGKWYVFVRKEGTPKPKLIHWLIIRFPYDCNSRGIQVYPVFIHTQITSVMGNHPRTMDLKLWCSIGCNSSWFV